MMNLSRLPDHPAFLRLSREDRALVFNSAELWEAGTGSVLYHPGDTGEDLLLIISGRVQYSDRSGGDRRWFPGELWGEERLIQPQPIAGTLIAAEDCFWLRWSRQTLLSLASSSPSLARALTPLRDRSDQLVSGLSVEIPGISAAKKGRSLRASLRPAAGGLILTVLGLGILAVAGTILPSLPRLVVLVPPALFLGWFMVFLFVRLLTEYGIETDAVTSRSFDWSRFMVESRHVPLDSIQGVEVERNGLIRRLFGYGSVIVKTSALEGELLIRDVNTPKLLAREISGMREAGSRRVESRDRESLRRTLEDSGFGENSPKIIRQAIRGNDRKLPDTDRRFRKSLVVMFARIILPLLVTLVPLLGAGAAEALTGVSANLIRLTAFLPLFWGWYIFEDWRNDSFRVSGGYAVDLYRKPLGLKESRRQVDLASVQNIRTEQKGLLSVLFRFGDVIIVTAGGASDTVFKNVSRPWLVQDSLFRAREEGLKRKSEKQMDERKDDLLRFAEAMDQIRNH